MYVCVGTSPGGVDVVNQKDVGIANMAVLTNLNLKDGQAYYVTITGLYSEFLNIGHRVR